MDKYYPRGGKTNGSNAAGYMIGDLVRHIIEKTGKDVTQERLMPTAMQVRDCRPPMLLPSISITITPDSYNIYNKLQLQEFDGAAWREPGEPISTHFSRAGIVVNPAFEPQKAEAGQGRPHLVSFNAK